jgi:hypothetical protein
MKIFPNRDQINAGLIDAKTIYAQEFQKDLMETRDALSRPWRTDEKTRVVDYLQNHNVYKIVSILRFEGFRARVEGTAGIPYGIRLYNPAYYKSGRKQDFYDKLREIPLSLFVLSIGIIAVVLIAIFH